MTKEKKIFGVLEFYKKGSPHMATFVMDESLLVEDEEDITGLIGATLQHMDWKRENTPLEVKCCGMAPAWTKTYQFHELDAFVNTAKEEQKEEEARDLEEEKSVTEEPYKPV